MEGFKMVDCKRCVHRFVCGDELDGFILSCSMYEMEGDKIDKGTEKQYDKRNAWKGENGL